MNSQKQLEELFENLSPLSPTEIRPYSLIIKSQDLSQQRILKAIQLPCSNIGLAIYDKEGKLTKPLSKFPSKYLDIAIEFQRHSMTGDNL